MTDLIALAADKNIEAGIRAVLQRDQSLGCRRFSYNSFVHPQHDPGCYSRAAEFLRVFARQYERALVIFDLEGSGSTVDRSTTEAEVESRLAASGWENGRAACVVVDPEIENWVWSDSPNVAQILGWQEALDLRSALQQTGRWPDTVSKPPRPKEALEFILWKIRRPRSSAIYAELGSTVGLTRCSDAAFLKLRAVLAAWFAEP